MEVMNGVYSMMETIRSLMRAVEKIGDARLRYEMLGQVTEVQARLVRTHEQLHAKQAEIEGLRAHLANSGNHGAWPSAIVYDPPA